MLIVVIEARAEAGQAGPALDSATGGFFLGGASSPGLRRTRFFQGRDDPERFLYLGSWASREAFTAAFEARRPALAGLSEPIVPRYFRPLLTFEQMLVPIEIAVCQIVGGPPSAGPELRAFFLDLLQPRQDSSRALVLSMVCEEIEVQGRFLLVSGWQTAEALAASVAVRGAEFVTRIAAAGATYRRFVGQTRFDSGLSVEPSGGASAGNPAE